jgi:hypothetical protein
MTSILTGRPRSAITQSRGRDEGSRRSAAGYIGARVPRAATVGAAGLGGEDEEPVQIAAEHKLTRLDRTRLG